MLTRLYLLMMLALMAGCTSTASTAPPKTTWKNYPGCDAPAWTWCIARANR